MQINFELFRYVAKALMSNSTVDVTPVRGLRKTTFNSGGQEILAIEQNPTKPSSWGKMAAEGKQVVQFKSVATDKYVAVSVNGHITPYDKPR